MFRFYKQLNDKFLQWVLNSEDIKASELVKDFDKCKIYDNNKLKFNRISSPDNLFVKTPSGYSKIKHVFKTVEYKKYLLTLEDKKQLVCADTHIVIDEHNIQRFVKDLTINSIIKTIDGVSRVESVVITNDYSTMYDIELEDNDHVLYTNGILSHNSQLTSALALWYAIFSSDVKILIASNAQRGATDLMNRIRFMYESLPDFLRPGVNYYNRGSIEFDNDSAIWSEATTENTGRGRSPSFIIIDEIAHIKPKIQEGMWASILPTISTGGKGCFMSTPNGDQDLFAGLCRGAELGTNEFKLITVDISEIPDRGKEWQEKEKRNQGELKFRQEQLCEFLSSDALLINSLILQTLRHSTPVFMDKGFSFWKDPDPKYSYVIGCDIGQGLGNDYSTIQIFELETLEQVAEYRNNSLSEDQFYKAIKYAISKISSYRDDNNHPPKIIWSYENNTIGATISVLYSNDEKFPHNQDIELVSSNNTKLGMVTSGKTKPESCRLLKNLVEKKTGNLKIHSHLLISELKNYVQSGGSYAAKHGATDDLISATLIVMQILKRMTDYDDTIFQKVYNSEQDFFDEKTDNFDEPIPFVM